ncbi:MAG TPA: phosphate signaling complex protein PhoU [Pyrinomonadaceae bacterium]|jgi:phosphate transport system protein|nr:phosphate signaling complex protein PhoU [Pyrinomonadaceae bacterium]
MEEHRLIGKRLEEVRELIIKMSSEAQTAVERSMQAVVERDSNIAAEVLAHDDAIDNIELEIDREVIEIFALLQPAARDLRFVIAVAKITPILERIADHAGNIASAAIELNNEEQLAEYIDLPKMAARASDMLRQAINAFTNEDSQLARRIIAVDKEIDSLYQKVVRELMDYMRTEPTTSTRVLQLLFVAKHIERIGDYVKDICELTVYMIEAEFIKHKFERTL